jgi:hypothetical protein
MDCLCHTTQPVPNNLFCGVPASIPFGQLLFGYQVLGIRHSSGFRAGEHAVDGMKRCSCCSFQQRAVPKASSMAANKKSSAYIAIIWCCARLMDDSCLACFVSTLKSSIACSSLRVFSSLQVWATAQTVFLVAQSRLDLTCKRYVFLSDKNEESWDKDGKGVC